jgi:hypothetical protein
MTIPPDLAFLEQLIGILAGTWPSDGSADDHGRIARAALEAL